MQETLFQAPSRQRRRQVVASGLHYFPHVDSIEALTWRSEGPKQGGIRTGKPTLLTGAVSASKPRDAIAYEYLHKETT
jgi:hypothetical protein